MLAINLQTKRIWITRHFESSDNREIFMLIIEAWSKNGWLPVDAPLSYDWDNGSIVMVSGWTLEAVA